MIKRLAYGTTENKVSEPFRSAFTKVTRTLAEKEKGNTLSSGSMKGHASHQTSGPAAS